MILNVLVWIVIILVSFMLLLFLVCIVFFFFKQKTAYEMRISDWSSDVCSSDLLEQELGCILFQRTGRRLEFTPAGHDVLKAARRALAAIADIRHVSDAHAVTPILRIATLGAIAAGM